MKITNNAGISLPLAVWLVHDEYDYVEGIDNYISVTTLMKPLKQIILPGRIPVEDRTADVEDFIARKLGQAIHDSIERAWEKGAHTAMGKLGYDNVVSRLYVNPTTEQQKWAREKAKKDGKDPIFIWLENRGYREIVVDGVKWTVGGKFDMVSDGILNDNKSTSAYGWVYGTREDDHIFQMSQYNWIDKRRTDKEPPRIDADFCNVQYIFTDWQKAQAKSNPNYPQRRVEQKVLSLLPLAETERRISDKLRLIAKHKDLPESQMPDCTDEELWRGEPKYKYYSDPEKAKQPGSRSTKNFDTKHEADAHKASQGKGVVVTIPGEVKACGYCAAYDICEQRKRYFP
jgi:hypothetical protein